jgi:hypothetical protein
VDGIVVDFAVEQFVVLLCIKIRLKGFPFFGVEDSDPDDDDKEDVVDDGIPKAEKKPSFIK